MLSTKLENMRYKVLWNWTWFILGKQWLQSTIAFSFPVPRAKDTPTPTLILLLTYYYVWPGCFGRNCKAQAKKIQLALTTIKYVKSYLDINNLSPHFGRLRWPLKFDKNLFLYYDCYKTLNLSYNLFNPIEGYGVKIAPYIDHKHCLIDRPCPGNSNFLKYNL